MAEIILVYGIAQGQCSADISGSTWLPALACGIRTAGDAEPADRIWRNGTAANARIAFHDGCVHRAGQLTKAEIGRPVAAAPAS
ncbi:hypothetical protein [Lentzea flava]|uniref:Uncharacterized protein n=1 Tax=Lentzea flava TaxID=103732 RepID=A0ABQ2UA80_9PSEU|nr:hypothetical protein [Lentzea flava]MCP2196834.1 hypothetical protein [Lentzea flava]GGU15173.1 hypothetical protein GCM10010178_03340 [Lentzea flava]